MGCNLFVETIHELSLQPIKTNDKLQRRGMLLPKIAGRFKMQTAKRINEFQKTTGRSFWQSRYYDHIIRDENEYLRIKQYIIDNPAKWDEDRNSIENLYM